MNKEEEKEEEYQELEERLLEEDIRLKKRPMVMSGKGVFKLKEIIKKKWSATRKI